MFGLMRNLYNYVKKSRTKTYTILIMGIDNAGKSTMLASLKGESSELITPTVGFSSEVLKKGNRNITLFDLGGSGTFRGIWKRYYAEVHGVIYVVDGSDASRISTAKDALHEALQDPRLTKKPVLILANKQDVSSALPIAEFSEKLGVNDIKSHYLIKRCSALQQGSSGIDPAIVSGLDWLFKSIESNYSELNKRILQQTAEQKEEEKREKEEKIKRVEALRKERELQKQLREAEERLKAEQNPPEEPHKDIEVLDPKAIADEHLHRRHSRTKLEPLHIKTKE